jgi:hypothetical protein
MEDINKAKGAAILDLVLNEFWKRVKYKSSLLLVLHYINKRWELKTSASKTRGG